MIRQITSSSALLSDSTGLCTCPEGLNTDSLIMLIDLAKKHNCAIITAHGTDTAKTRPQTPID